MARRVRNYPVAKVAFSLLPLNFLLSALMTSSMLSAVGSVPTFSLSESDFKNLPTYCKITTGFFPCVDNGTGAVNCHSVALLCRIRCANDALLNCPHSVKSCSVGQYQCESRPEQLAKQPVCLSDHLLCDGRLHCPLGDDESPQLCQSRMPCPPGLFACRSPGHCLPLKRRCDGFNDCRRPGLDDPSDETACPIVSAKAVSTNIAECSSVERLCDGFPDCADGSDERDCPDVFDVDGSSNNAPLKPRTPPESTALPEFEPDSTLPSSGPVRIVVATIDTSRHPALSLISSRNGEQVSISTNKFFKSFGVVLTFDGSTGRAILFDALSGRLRIFRWLSALDSFDQENDVNLGGGLNITDAAFDSTRRLLFYTSEIDGSVGVIAVDAGWRATLRLLDCPQSLLVQPETAGLFLALSCGPSPGIYRLSMDGIELQLLLGSELVGRPIRFDFDSIRHPQRLYWIDAKLLGVFSIRLEDGGDVKRHFAWPLGQLEIETARLIVHSNHLYLAAMSSRAIWSVRQLSLATGSSDASSSSLVKLPGILVTMVGEVFLNMTEKADRLVPSCACEQICVPVWHNIDGTECLCDWRHRLVRLPNSQRVLCNAGTTATATESASTAATDTVSTAATDTVSTAATDTVADICSTPKVLDQQLIVLGVSISVAVILLIACVCLWLCSRYWPQSTKLTDTDEPETAKLTSAQTVITMVSIDSQAHLTGPTSPV